MLVFDAVLRAGSMSAAALELRYSAAAVSQQIAALEAEAGTPLLTRLPRGVTATGAGRIAGLHARALAERLTVASDEIAAVAHGSSGPLRIASFPGASAGLLPEAILALTAERPALTVSVEERPPDLAIAALRDGAVDLALVADISTEQPVDVSGLDAVTLGRATVSVMLPAGHRLAGHAIVALADLVTDAWIQSEDILCSATLARVAADLNVVSRVKTFTKDVAATRGLVAAGLGIALVTDLIGLEDGRGIVVRRLTPRPSYPVLALTPLAPSALPAARVLGARLAEQSAEVL